MQIEYVAGVRLTSGRAANQQRQRTVGHRVLGQIVVNHEHILALIHKILAHCAARIGGDILHRRQLAGRGRHHNGIIHCAGNGERIHHLRHGRTLLADGNVNTNNVLTLLIDNGIRCNNGFARLTVADDQLALAAADGNHAVDGLDTRLQRNRNTLALDDAGRLAFNGAHLGGLNGALAVDRLAQRVYHAAHHCVAHRHTDNTACPFYRVALFNTLVGAQQHDGYTVLL